MGTEPRTERVAGAVSVYTDLALRARTGITIAFTERGGGVSGPPYASLNLAGHVGDDAESVDENRMRLLDALGVSGFRADLTTAEQVHGAGIGIIDRGSVGAGAFAASGRAPVAGVDAMLTTLRDVPLLMFYADCVPVILVAEDPVPAVAVVHAGWRGAFAALPGGAAERLASVAGCTTSRVSAYIGPHIGACCYEVDAALLSQFVNKFGTIAAVEGHLDLAGVVTASLVAVGIPDERIAHVGVCTFDSSDRFYSYRASQATGRHGALAVITEVE